MRFVCLVLATTAAFFLSTGLKSQSTEPAEESRRAWELVVAGKPEEAIPIYEELLRAAPDNPTLLVNLALAQFKAGQYREAVAQCEAALRLRPELLSAWLFLGASYFELGEHDRAVGPLQKVIETEADERNARLMLAESLLLLERYKEAVQHFRKASQLLPNEPRVWYGLEWSCRVLSRRAFLKLEKTTLEGGYWHALVADSYLEQHRYGNAFHHYRQALTRLPNLSSLHVSLATVYRKSGHLDWAKAEEEKQHHVATADCGSGKLECDFLAGRYWDVAESAKSQKTAEAYYWESKAYRKIGGQAFSRLSQLPPSPQFHELAARNLEDLGRHLEAAQEWRKALKLSPGDPALRKGLAVSLHYGLDHKAALPLLKELVKLEPDSTELNFLCGSTLLLMQQPEKAIPFLQGALKNDPGFVLAQAALGQAYLQTGEAERAITYLEAAVADDEDGSRHYQLVRAYQSTGRTNLARQTLQEYHQKVREAAEAKRRELEKEYQITPP